MHGSHVSNLSASAVPTGIPALLLYDMADLPNNLCQVWGLPSIENKCFAWDKSFR